MRLYLINPSNPLVSILKVKESRWNRFRVWKPLSLMVLAGLTSPEWEITIVDENLGTPDYPAMPLPELLGNISYRNNLRLNSRAYADFKRQVSNSTIMYLACNENRVPHPR
jgi:hypothetical protein